MPNSIFDGTEGAYIVPSEAKSYLDTYKLSLQYSLNQGIKGHFFGEDILNDMLAQNGAKGLRIYYGLKSVAEAPSIPQLIVVATDENGDDILGSGKIADASQPCPPLCGNTQIADE